MTRLRSTLACICLMSCLILFTSAVHAELNLADGTATGQWFNSARDGEGFWIEVIDAGEGKAIAVSMYSYDELGNQLWLAGSVGINSGDTVATIPVILVEGPLWGSAYDPAARDVTDFGSIIVRFPTCNSALFNVTSNVPGLESGNYSLVRLTTITGMECTDEPPAPPPDPPPTPEGGVTPGLWAAGETCFFVNAEGNKIVESDLCDEGKALSMEAPGFEVDLNGRWDPDACQANAICNGAWTIYFEEDHASATCINNLEGTVSIYFHTPTEAQVEGWQETGQLNWCVGIVPSVKPSTVPSQ